MKPNAANGTLRTGGTLADLIRYGNTSARRDFDKVYARAMKKLQNGAGMKPKSAKPKTVKVKLYADEAYPVLTEDDDAGFKVRIPADLWAKYKAAEEAFWNLHGEIFEKYYEPADKKAKKQWATDHPPQPYEGD